VDADGDASQREQVGGDTPPPCFRAGIGVQDQIFSGIGAAALILSRCAARTAPTPKQIQNGTKRLPKSMQNHFTNPCKNQCRKGVGK
jgi:hypothetical protein